MATSRKNTHVLVKDMLGRGYQRKLVTEMVERKKVSISHMSSQVRNRGAPPSLPDFSNTALISKQTAAGLARSSKSEKGKNEKQTDFRKLKAASATVRYVGLDTVNAGKRKGRRWHYEGDGLIRKRGLGGGDTNINTRGVGARKEPSLLRLLRVIHEEGAAYWV